ncbi:harpin HrpZ family protein [Pseudomonas sp. B21-056]|jgi:hypothetical protein|uniref:harpin HrpZ family protein n=1 Tax=Pseudomonas sp. B21-056 TaxID=2895495 RepID=UPI002231FDFF|nr:harpin HrpZ family protein [Pseudomonas sp. B21-056]UZE25639.1 harpin HrpZ family protein [Pseudomonas sp. B21-056]
MQGSNGINQPRGIAAFFSLPGVHNATSDVSKSSKALQDVISQLVKALTKDGQLDESSPLGKMLAKMMAANGNHRRDPESVAKALDNFIHKKLGDNFGASADLATGSGNGANGGGLGGAGQPDLMTQVLNGFGKALLDDLLTKQNNGATFSRDDMPILKKIAQFMDDNKAQFPSPDSGSWTKELKEDNFLDDDETAKFRAALDLISQQFGKQQDDVSPTDGGLGSLLTDSANAPGNADTASNPVPDTTDNSSGSLGLSGESGGGLGSPIGVSPQAGGNQGDITLKLDLGQLLGGGVKVGLELSVHGPDLQSSAAQTAAQITNSLLHGSNYMAEA